MSPHTSSFHTLVLASATIALVAGPATSARAAPLAIVEVAAPDINCVFDADCTITVQDFADHFVLAAANGDAFLQSRMLPVGEPGTPGEGLYAYEYRLDLRKLVGLTAIPCVRTLRIEFGDVVPLDYDDDGKPDHVFVVTAGGLGTVAPDSAEQIGNVVEFRFSSPVCAGSFSGGGASTFFFGMASRRPPVPVSASIADTLGGMTALEARGPDLSRPIPVSPPRFVRGDSNGSGTVDLADAVFTLQWLFLGGKPSGCEAAADTNDDGELGIGDPIALLNHLFLGGPAPAAPFPGCGVDPNPGPLGCDRYEACPDMRCTDPAAQAIEYEIASRASRFAGVVRIAGRVANLGGPFDSSPGQQAAVLYETIPGGRPTEVARVAFEDLGPGETLDVVYERSWNASSPAEGEFPPSYRLVISYDPDLYIDGNDSNDDCVPENNSLERSGVDINALFL